MKLLLVTTLLPFTLFGGVIKSPSGCSLPAVQQELKDIIKRETGQNVKELQIATPLSIDTASPQLCQCKLSIDGKKYFQYAYAVTPIDKAYVGLPNHIVKKYQSMSDVERKKYVRVEYLKSLDEAIKDGGL